MARKKVRPEDLTEEQLRRLLIQKRRTARRKRLDEFRRSGRLVEVVPIPDDKPAETLGSIDLEAPEPPSKVADAVEAGSISITMP